MLIHITKKQPKSCHSYGAKFFRSLLHNKHDTPNGVLQNI